MSDTWLRLVAAPHLEQVSDTFWARLNLRLAGTRVRGDPCLVVTDADVAWAAGVFEGEGTITQIERFRGSLDLQLAINMTDEDVLRRFDEIVDRGRLYGPYLPPSHGDRRKPVLALDGDWRCGT